MNNHYYLQIRSSEIPFSKLMSLINKRYADYYNTKYHLTGHVYEKRYYDQLIEDKQGMLEVSRYIHLNPVKAKMVKDPENYPWSSFYLFKYPHSSIPSFLNLNSLLDYYEGTVAQKREKYCNSLLGPVGSDPHSQHYDQYLESSCINLSINKNE